MNRELVALFSRPAMRCNPRSWCVLFQPSGRVLHAGTVNRSKRTLSGVKWCITYRAAIVGVAPAWLAP